ncbi:hypothetical protein [Cytobacillus oceanisediminis]|uniref:hypothetical protein n=1 Tax=Cytobacillus TaxID=2675230 RepID=UPI001C2342BC|nr:hypothetical protein [Cytobacillus oceanisediminis]MCS0825872.1 hypothetical protein [Cytobacillus firmus]MBU8730249.1 hypothetical protein [Cytobacillus oceanisediminis]MCM3242075.1 hypothetical protein [Cytobacillus oceanisediminis]MCM3403265.1 hypothetical protein [Cytobacillus oceanisediminis]MDK7667765.1 hypothetical protein [Cytobacillus oceanisediminis]
MKENSGRFDFYSAIIISVIAILLMIRNMITGIEFFSVTNALSVFALVVSLRHLYNLTMASQKGESS